jgi:murein DD-endopeptidase MepM/ murein hydrolase activator NlpD
MRPVARFLALAATALALPFDHVAAQLSSPLELRVPKPPTLATADGGAFLAYELHITNFAPAALSLRRIEVLSDERTLLTLEDSALVRALARPGISGAAVDRPRIGGGLRAVVFLWVPVATASARGPLRHRLTLEVGSGDSVRTRVAEGAVIEPSRDIAVIGPPLRGTNWLTANGPANESGHRRALIPIDGTPAIAQRFAIDYVQVDSAERTHSGAREDNANYYAYGEDALAVMDGVVTATKDSIPENIPGPTSRAVPITLETVGGNYVIIDIGAGRYAFYAHLQPGSLRVRTGDRVRRGQVLGLVGNSGNSTEPHLHFHLADGTTPLGAEGIPYVHDAFEIVGRCRSLLGGCAATTAEIRRRETPLANVIIRFPQ